MATVQVTLKLTPDEHRLVTEAVDEYLRHADEMSRKAISPDYSGKARTIWQGKAVQLASLKKSL